MMMGWPPKIYCREVDDLVDDFYQVIAKREKEMENGGRIYTNNAIICALEMVKTRIIASEVMCVQRDSER